MNVLILGVGNLLLSDESIGVHVVNQLEHRYQFPEGVELLDGGTAGMELLDAIAGRKHIVIIDAVLTGDSPGTIVDLYDDEVPALFNNKVSPHQLGLSDLLGALKLTGESPENIYLIGIIPESVEPGLEMTASISGQMENMTQRVLNYLNKIGVQPELKEDALCV